MLYTDFISQPYFRLAFFVLMRKDVISMCTVEVPRTKRHERTTLRQSGTLYGARRRQRQTLRQPGPLPRPHVPMRWNHLLHDTSGFNPIRKSRPLHKLECLGLQPGLTGYFMIGQSVKNGRWQPDICRIHPNYRLQGRQRQKMNHPRYMRPITVYP